MGIYKSEMAYGIMYEQQSKPHSPNVDLINRFHEHFIKERYGQHHNSILEKDYLCGWKY